MNPNVYEADNIRVEFVELGEGRDGDYDPSDPTDIELLRFDVSMQLGEPGEDEWEVVDDGSYCCGIPVDATEEQKQEALRYIHSKIGNPPRKLSMQAVSWIALNADGTLFTTSADEMLGATN
jgi:hypothetical protein